MNCPSHPEAAVVGTCAACEGFVCEKDSLEAAEMLYCRTCVPTPDELVAPRRRRPSGRKARPVGGWLPFHEARRFVRSLGLGSAKDWRLFTLGKLASRLPANVPACPERAYSNDWNGWRDWLGTEGLPPRRRVYRSFEDARSFVRGLALRGEAEWRLYSKGLIAGLVPKPADVPADPHHVYEAWTNWGDFLGTGKAANQNREFLPFEEARSYVRALGLHDVKEWWAYSKGELPERGKRPPNVPGLPSRVYRGRGWKGYLDWLGAPAVQRRARYRPFENARAFVRALGLRTAEEWSAFSAGHLAAAKGTRPADVPSVPSATYAAEWNGWKDWLGVPKDAPRFRRRTWRPFAEARSFVRALGLSSARSWRDYVRGLLPEKCDRPEDVPTAPNQVYREEWTSWGDWLGNGNVASGLLARAGEAPRHGLR